MRARLFNIDMRNEEKIIIGGNWIWFIYLYEIR